MFFLLVGGKTHCALIAARASDICMVLHTVQFMNSFPRKGGLKHYPPSAIMTGAKLHMSQLQLKFGSYCQVAEDVTPRNSLAACTRGTISMGPSRNFSGGQRFLTLDTGKMIGRNRWKELPMPSAVINRINVLGHAERSILVFTDPHCHRPWYWREVYPV